MSGLDVARRIAVAATIVLLPTSLLALSSRVFLALAVLEAAVLAMVTAYAAYLGVYRYPR